MNESPEQSNVVTPAETPRTAGKPAWFEVTLIGAAAILAFVLTAASLGFRGHPLVLKHAFMCIDEGGDTTGCFDSAYGWMDFINCTLPAFVSFLTIFVGCRMAARGYKRHDSDKSDSFSLAAKLFAIPAIVLGFIMVTACLLLIVGAHFPGTVTDRVPTMSVTPTDTLQKPKLVHCPNGEPIDVTNNVCVTPTDKTGTMFRI